MGEHDFRDTEGRCWLQIRGSVIHIREGYAWDGATCAPDFPDVIVASLCHDVLCQFREVPCFPLTKSQIDNIFRDLMPSTFYFRWVYWGTVRALGGVFSKVTGGLEKGLSCGLHTHDK